MRKDNTIIIFGLGAIGSNLLLQLVKVYPESEFIGIDFDKVEERNINTQAYLLPHIGMYKVNAMYVIIGLNTRKIKYIPIIQKIKNRIEIVEILDIAQTKSKDYLLIDCFDNSASRKLLEGIDNCLHISFSWQYTAEIIWGDRYTTPDDVPGQDICDMMEAVPFINYVVGLAGLVISKYLKTGIKDSFIIIDKYKIRKL